MMKSTKPHDGVIARNPKCRKADFQLQSSLTSIFFSNTWAAGMQQAGDVK
jgi:hypothetical protein